MTSGGNRGSSSRKGKKCRREGDKSDKRVIESDRE